MICVGVAPIDCAASTNPEGTSNNAPSIRRATKGMAPMVNGTIAAVVPIKLPTINFVTGIKPSHKTTINEISFGFTADDIDVFNYSLLQKILVFKHSPS